jgi:RsiW-degrading membrane proteinase PrsW (M82 family)
MLVNIVVLACAVLLGMMVYRYDLYEKEPWYLLLFAVVVGYLVFWGLGYVEDFSNARLGFYEPGGEHTAGQAAVAATHEELSKLLVVVLMALLFRRHFNDPMDGLIYGAFAALGMALEESFYLLQFPFRTASVEPGIDIIGREVARLVLHILMGGISGFGVGLIVEHSRLRYWFLVLLGFLAASMTIHFLWDYLCGIPAASRETTPEAEVFLRSVAVFLMLLAMGVFAIAVVLGSRLSRSRFAPDSDKRLSRWSLFH